MNDLWHLSAPVWHFIFRGGFIYLFLIFLLRLGGKRQVGQMGAGEFVAILLISNAVQNSMNGGDNSITAGVILSSTIVALSVLIAYGTYRSRAIERLIEARPTLLIHKGVLSKTNLKRELLSEEELLTMLRKQGIHSFNEVQEAVLESDGALSVIRKAEVDPKLL